MMGATPATLTRSLCSTPSANPAATPASTALPPPSSIAKPACAPKECPAEMTCRRAEITGRWDVIALIVVLPRWLAHRASLHACSAPAQLWASGHHCDFSPFADGGGPLGKMPAA